MDFVYMRSLSLQERGELSDHGPENTRLHSLPKNLNCGRVMFAVNDATHESLDLALPEQTGRRLVSTNGPTLIL